MRMAIAAACVVSLFACTKQRVTVSFWATDRAAPGNVPVFDHPCGRSLLLSVSAIPRDVDWLEYDRVFEINPEGRILRTWAVPIDQYPVGVDGQDLLLAYGSSPETALRVGLNGALSTSSLSQRVPLEQIECPDDFREFEDSAYAICAKEPGNSGALLAYEGPCT